MKKFVKDILKKHNALLILSSDSHHMKLIPMKGR